MVAFDDDVGAPGDANAAATVSIVGLTDHMIAADSDVLCAKPVDKNAAASSVRTDAAVDFVPIDHDVVRAEYINRVFLHAPRSRVAPKIISPNGDIPGLSLQLHHLTAWIWAGRVPKHVMFD